MGGNALRPFGITTGRLDNASYLRLVDDLMPRLSAALPMLRLDALPHIREKPDFGDLDIIASEKSDAVVAHSDWHGFHTIVAEIIGATTRVNNGPYTSLDVDCRLFGIGDGDDRFQLDLIRVPTASHDFSVGYYSHNDLGNLIGLQARKFGVKLGHFGLLLPLRPDDDPSYLFQEVPLTHDYHQAVRWLGFDEKMLAKGFDTFEDMYRFVMSSPYADADIYRWGNRNAKGRVRDKKRTTYNRFLKWLDSNEQPHFDWSGQGQMARETFWARVAAESPASMERIAQAKNELDFNRMVKSRYNGARVSTITGLTGPALGAVMGRIRSSFTAERDYLEWAVAASDQDILLRWKQLRSQDTGMEPS